MKKWKKQGLKTLSAALSASMVMTSVAFGGEWKYMAPNWQMLENGKYLASQWYKDTDGRWYRFDANGNMVTGWYQDVDGKWYYMDGSGMMLANAWALDGAGKWYYVGSDGAMLSDQWVQDATGKWYYVGTGGVMLSDQWVQDAVGKWYYVGSNGAMLTGGRTPDGYLLNGDGSWNESSPRDTSGSRGDDSGGGSSGSGRPGRPSQPDNPDNPDNPDTPGDPDNPDNPGNPDTPGNPDNPDNPDTPGNPDNPGQPDDPDDSEETLAGAFARAANGAENAGTVTGDTVEFLTGSTYRFTVDTANNQNAGLTSTSVTAGQFRKQLSEAAPSGMTITVGDAQGTAKAQNDPVVSGDKVTVTRDGETRVYTVREKRGALRGLFEAVDDQLTVGSGKDLVLNFHAGQRTPDGTVVIDVPAGIDVSMDNTYVNIIGRGEVALDELSDQSPGRWGGGYNVKVGEASVSDLDNGGSRILLTGLDLKPDNGIDVQLRIEDVVVAAPGNYEFQASYQVTEPERLESPVTSLVVKAGNTISSFERVLDRSPIYNVDTDYQAAEFAWAGADGADRMNLLHSDDKGATWSVWEALDPGQTEVLVENMEEDMEHWFCLDVQGGANAGRSNIAKVYSGMYNVRTQGGAPTNGSNAAGTIDAAIDYLNSLGGGTLLFEGGKFSTATVHLKSNVYLYIDESAELLALKNCDAPEVTWFSDRDYRSGTSPTSMGPYNNPENWLSKQDVGHTYWQNAMFYGQRLDNIKIIGNGRIAGNGNLNTGDGVMNNSADNRADKMVALKLCTNFEMGGLSKSKDLWYEETGGDPNQDEPFYLNSDGSRDEDLSNMLKVSRGGHFVLLATGVDGVSTHDVYAEKANGGVRDIFDYMACSDVLAANIYAAGSSDDIVKPGSDCSLGFTRPARNYVVRNIIGDTNCNLFQIGSETADDIQDICVDNIYVLAGNKAGFSISTNDGGHVKDIHLNCGGTVGACKYGTGHDEVKLGYEPAQVHPFRSEMRRTRAPFFLSISNRGRIMGGEAVRTSFTDPNGTKRDELLSTNVNIGYVENVFINDVNVEEVYGGSQYKGTRWTAYSNQNKATPIIAGYKVPEEVGIRLPDGRGVGYLENVEFNRVDVLVKGGNPLEDSWNSPKEMGVGQYNVGDLAGDARGSMLPSYGFWARHVKNLVMEDCKVSFEKNDDRFAIVLDDVEDAVMTGMTMVQPENNRNLLELVDCSNITMKDSVYHERTLEGTSHDMTTLEGVTVKGRQTYPTNLSTSVKIKKRDNPPKQVVTEIVEGDTPALKVIFGAQVQEVKEAIESDDGSAQAYHIFREKDGEREEVTDGKLENGDRFQVVAEDRVSRAEYQVEVAPSSSTDLKMTSDTGCILEVDNTNKTIQVLTGTTTAELLGELSSDDGSQQTYEIAGAKDGDPVSEGGTLSVTAEDGKAKVDYQIHLSQDLRITAAEDGYFVQSVNNQKKTITVLRGTTPKQLVDSVAPRREDVELEFEVLTAEGGAKDEGSVQDGDILKVSLISGSSITRASESWEYKIITARYQAASTVLEGESESYTMYGKTMTQKTNNEGAASGGKNRQFENCEVGDYVEYRIADLAAGRYELEYTYKTANNNRRGIIGASFNGQELPGRADANDTVANKYLPYSYGTVVQEESGEAVIRLTVVEAGSGSAPYNFIVDCLTFKGCPSPNTNLVDKKTDGSRIIEIDNDEKVIKVMKNTTVEQILTVESADGSEQTRQVRRGEEVLASGAVADGDVLRVTAQDKTNSADYRIEVDENAISRELEFENAHWISGEFYLEPGTTVAELPDLITADFQLEFTVSETGAGDEIGKGDEDLIYDGDVISVTDKESGDEIQKITARVYTEKVFAVYDADTKTASMMENVTVKDGVSCKASSDTITSDTTLRVPYMQGLGETGAYAFVETEPLPEGSYRLDVIYKSGTRSQKVKVEIIEKDTTVKAGSVDAASAAGPLWLADMEGRNKSKTYIESEVMTMNLAGGSYTIRLTNEEAKEVVLVEVKLTLLGEPSASLADNQEKAETSRPSEGQDNATLPSQTPPAENEDPQPGSEEDADTKAPEDSTGQPGEEDGKDPSQGSGEDKPSGDTSDDKDGAVKDPSDDSGENKDEDAKEPSGDTGEDKDGDTKDPSGDTSEDEDGDAKDPSDDTSEDKDGDTSGDQDGDTKDPSGDSGEDQDGDTNDPSGDSGEKEDGDAGAGGDKDSGELPEDGASHNPGTDPGHSQEGGSGSQAQPDGAEPEKSGTAGEDKGATEDEGISGVDTIK